MKNGLKNGLCYSWLLHALVFAAPSFAEMSLFVSPDGDGGFIVEGDNAQGAEAIDITIGYDTATLANPRVEAQGGTLNGISIDTPGVLTVAISRENPDSAFELHLQFEKKGELPGVLKYISAVATNTDGRKYAPASDSRALSQPMVPVLEEAGAGEVPKKDPEHDATSSTEMGTVNGDKSVLQRFREFRGEKVLKAFAPLFERSDRERIVQEPAIALSDGKTSVRIRLALQPQGTNPPNIALTDAELISVRKTGENSWEITVVPAKGTSDASLTVVAGREPIEVPLVVAPPVAISDDIDEKGFPAALRTYVAERTAAGKGENDSARQEYIFTANYLVRRSHRSVEGIAASPSQAEKKKTSSSTPP